MPTILMEIRDMGVYTLLSTGEISPLLRLRQELKVKCAPILIYPERAFIVNWNLPRVDAGTDPDSPALVITITASDKQHHRNVGKHWADAIEKVIRNLECFDNLIALGGATIFLPVGEGVFRVIEK